MNITEVELLALLARKYGLAKLLVGDVEIITTGLTFQTPDVALPAAKSLEEMLDDPDLY